MVPSKSLFLPVLLLGLLVSPVIVSAQSFDFRQDVFVGVFGFESTWWDQPRELILNAFIPFFAIYIIFLGLLRTIGIFRAVSEGLEHAISLTVAFAALFSGGIGYISGALSFLGGFSFAIFFVLFFVGAVLYSIGFTRRRHALTKIAATYKHDSRSLDSQIEAANKEIGDLNARISHKEGRGENTSADRKKRDRLYIEIGFLREQRRKMEGALKDAAS